MNDTRDHPLKTSAFFQGKVSKMCQICRWIKPFQNKKGQKFEVSSTKQPFSKAFLLGTSIVFDPCYFETALVVKNYQWDGAKQESKIVKIFRHLEWMVQLQSNAKLYITSNLDSEKEAAHHSYPSSCLISHYPY